MTMKQTCCPFCHSAFYVTTLQLNAYKGQARCGQCHQVFDALANLIVKNPAPATPSIAEDTAEALEPIQAVAEPEMPASSNLSQAVVETTDDSHTVVLQQNFRKPAPADTAKAVPVAEAPSTKASSVDEEELLFSDDHGIDDDAENTPQASANTSTSSLLLDDTFDQQFLNGGADSKNDLFEKQPNQVEKLHHAADDSWIEDLLKEDEAEAKKAAQQAREAATPRKKTYDTEAPPANNYAESFSEPKRPAYISDHEEDLLSYLNRTGVTRSPAPDPLTSIAEQKPASHRILQPSTKTYSSNYVFSWLLMIGLMLGLLICQFVYFNFEELAINPKTSDKVEKMCRVLRCNIPYMNAGQIKIRNLKVTASAPGETTFKAMLVNTAKMSQPFPALKLSLKRNGEIIASQVIQPRQYLPDDLKTLTRLATKSPYPVEFTIKKNRSEIRDFTLEPTFK